MLLDFSTLISKYKMDIKGVIQVGCHHAEEYEMMRGAGIKNFILIEPASAAFRILKEKFAPINDNDPEVRVELFICALADYEGKAILNIETANKGQSNSLLKPKNHLRQYPTITFGGTEEVNVTTLDRLLFDRSLFNLLCMDVQCAEMRVLRGGTDTLKDIDYIISEVNAPGAELYENCTDIEEMDRFLKEHGFIRTEEPKWIGGTWSDSFWIRQSKIAP